MGKRHCRYMARTMNKKHRHYGKKRCSLCNDDERVKAERDEKRNLLYLARLEILS
ncbi:MAG: hypothetical protein ACFFCS_05290 [Candidatus Hodarchaeota archaeon]